ncbi:MAG: PhnD/SsuA/transferrin family substrate-binding protein [Actinobacteria bacterium]|nr:PhnD/SsuA/transferrin family substrate-binding protein [Actinomycetota bacterium]
MILRSGSRRGYRTSLLASLSVLTLFLAACGGGDDTAGSPDAAPEDSPAEGDTETEAAGETSPDDGDLEVVDLTVGVLPIAAHAPAYAAVEQGYFEEEGFENVELQFGEGGAAMLPLAVQGNLDVAQVPISTAVQARTEGLDFVLLPAGTYQTKLEEPDHTATVVRKDSGITTVADLARKTIAVNVINSVNWLYNRAMLEEHGVDPDSVTYQEVPFPNMADALVNGSVDAIATVQPFVHFALQNEDLEVLAYDFLEVYPGMLISGFGVAESWVEDNPNATAAFNRAIRRAVEEFESDPETGIALTAEYTDSDEAIIRAVGLPSWVTEIDPAFVEQQIGLMGEHGMIEQGPAVEELYWSTDEIEAPPTRADG